MKIDKQTALVVGLTATIMASAVRADEAKMSMVQTALSSTTISGYVSASMNYEISPSAVASSPAGNIPFQAGKANGFNLDSVMISLDKPEDESPWASGYHVDLWFGPDASGFNNSISGNSGLLVGNSEMAIRQAYVTLRTPVGNGIDWKFGVFGNIIGYESTDPVLNPNYTHSWAWAVEPIEHTGILGNYKFNDELSLQVGVANTLFGGINARNTYNSTVNPGVANSGTWKKSVVSLLTYTLPSSCGWAAGSIFYAGFDWGFADTTSTTSGRPDQGGNEGNFYAGATLNTPWKALTVGGSFDYVQNLGGVVDINGNGLGGAHLDDTLGNVYATYQATDKLSFSGHGEYWNVDAQGGGVGSDDGMALTGTITYKMWANVISRLEVRWDQVLSSQNGVYILPTGIEVTDRSSVGIYANVAYKF